MPLRRGLCIPFPRTDYPSSTQVSTESVDYPLQRCSVGGQTAKRIIRYGKAMACRSTRIGMDGNRMDGLVDWKSNKTRSVLSEYSRDNFQIFAVSSHVVWVEKPI